MKCFDPKETRRPPIRCRRSISAFWCRLGRFSVHNSRPIPIVRREAIRQSPGGRAPRHARLWPGFPECGRLPPAREPMPPPVAARLSPARPACRPRPDRPCSRARMFCPTSISAMSRGPQPDGLPAGPVKRRSLEMTGFRRDVFFHATRRGRQHRFGDNQLPFGLATRTSLAPAAESPIIRLYSINGHVGSIGSVAMQRVLTFA
jgi:hypothetical protein